MHNPILCHPLVSDGRDWTGLFFGRFKERKIPYPDFGATYLSIARRYVTGKISTLCYALTVIHAMFICCTSHVFAKFSFRGCLGSHLLH